MKRTKCKVRGCPTQPGLLFVIFAMLLGPDPILSAPIHDAAKHNRTGVIRQLILQASKQRDGKNRVRRLVNFPNQFGNTPLHLVVAVDTATSQGRRSDVSLVALLVQNGANVNARNKEGKTPLFIAAAMTDSSAFLYLLRNGANLQVRDAAGRTILHETARAESTLFQNVKMTKALLDLGFNPNLADSNNQTAVDEVFEVRGYMGVQHVLELLESRGASLRWKERKQFIRELLDGERDFDAMHIVRTMQIAKPNDPEIALLHAISYYYVYADPSFFQRAKELGHKEANVWLQRIAKEKAEVMAP